MKKQTILKCLVIGVCIIFSRMRNEAGRSTVGERYDCNRAVSK